jgi:predicted phosphodiesterase
VKIQLASDLHLEFFEKIGIRNDPCLISPAEGAELLILAGDITHGANAAETFCNWPVPVVYVSGNHEFYNGHLESTVEATREESQRFGIHYLENNAVVFGDIRILGCTLWTNYRLQGLNRTQRQLMEKAAGQIIDHRAIQCGDGNRTFMPADALELHEASRKWLETELVKPWRGKTVVVTHHAPHPRSVHPRFLGDALSAAFVSDLTEVMGEVDLWCHGHVHDSFDYQVGRCRVVANPAGYCENFLWSTSDRFKFENRKFDPSLVLEV